MRLKEYAQKGFRAGVNAALTGNFLTTTGTTIKEDVQNISSIGFNIKKNA